MSKVDYFFGIVKCNGKGLCFYLSIKFCESLEYLIAFIRERNFKR